MDCSSSRQQEEEAQFLAAAVNRLPLPAAEYSAEAEEEQPVFQYSAAAAVV